MFDRISKKLENKMAVYLCAFLFYMEYLELMVRVFVCFASIILDYIFVGC